MSRAIVAAGDALYRDESAIERLADAGRTAGDGSASRRSSQADTLTAAARRRADALAILAERALAAGLGEDAPISGTRAAQYQVVLHVDTATLGEEGGEAAVVAEGGDAPWDGGAAGSAEGAGPAAALRSHLDDGTRVSDETSQRICCDAAVVKITHRPDGSILDVGRRTRTIPPAVRRALEARDRGCRFPGCGSRFCDAHHVRHWGQGGETSLANTVLLCRQHHRLVHEGGWRVGWGAMGEPVFIDPRGGVHYDARPRLPEVPADPVAALVEAHRARGIEPDWGTAGRRWRMAG